MPVDIQHRTAVTKLTLEEDQVDRLERTVDAWREGCQIATDLAWNTCHQPGDVQSIAYDEIRELTGLGSQHAVLATRQAAAAIQGCIDRFSRGLQASKPEFTAPSRTTNDR